MTDKKKAAPKKSVRAGNNNPGGSKNFPNKMLNALSITNPFGIGMRHGLDDLQRPGDGQGIKSPTPANKPARPTGRKKPTATKDKKATPKSKSKK